MDVYTPDDQVDRLKNWWKQYGVSVVTGIAIGLSVLGGLKYWQYHRIQQSERASPIYLRLLSEIAASQKDVANKTAGLLMTEYGGTPYAGKAALLLARIHFDAGDIDAARRDLQWAIDHAKETAVQHSARLRLARILLDQKDLEGARRLVDVRSTGGFESAYLELRGDLATLQGDREAAYRAYRSALEALPPGSGYRSYLAMKRDSAGTGETP